MVVHHRPRSGSQESNSSGRRRCGSAERRMSLTRRRRPPPGTRARRIAPLLVAGLSVVAAGAGAAGCAGTAAVTTSGPRTVPSAVLLSTSSLVAPRASGGDDARYLNDVTDADPALGTYLSKDGNVALRALLTDGSAFCAFLARGGGIDKAMVSLAIGVRGVEKTTHLPLGMTTFNTIEASALLTLCAPEQARVPIADRRKIDALGRELAGTSG